MRTYGYFAAFTLFAMTGLALAAAASPADVLTAESTLNQAVLAHDVPTISKYITDDYTLTLGSGKLMDRAAFLAFVAEPSLRLTINRAHDQRVRFYGESTAIITGIVEEAGTAGAAPFDIQVPYTDTWVLQNGQWSQAAGHGSSPLKQTM